MKNDEKKRVSRVADRWICKWWDEVHSPTATDLLTKLLLKEIKRAERMGHEAGYKKATEDQVDIRIRNRRTT